jgi:hypothetical protein
MNTEREIPKLILCVPGPWTSRTDLLERVIRDNEDYVFAGGIIMNLKTQFACELDFQETTDSRMAEAFALSVPSDDRLMRQSIAAHKAVVYLIGPGGARAAAESMMLTAAAVLKAGGLGVKVETSGIAHSADRWHGLVSDLANFSAHEALVLYVRGQQIRSCGMHNLGLPEAAINAGAPGATVEVLKTYTRYLFAESPTIHEGQTFSVEPAAPVFSLSYEAGFDYPLCQTSCRL